MVVGKLIDKDQYSYGFDAQTGEYGDLVPIGIIDPTKVVRGALQDAASVAGLIVTTEAMVGEHPKKGARSPRHARRRYGRHGLLIHRTSRRKKEARENSRAFFIARRNKNANDHEVKAAVLSVNERPVETTTQSGHQA